MENALLSQESRRELILFRLGSQEFCIDIKLIREIRGWSPATPLPHAPPYLRGVINLRGAVLPIIDLGVRFGIETEIPGPHHVIIVVQIGERQVGMLVDAVSDILTVDPDAVRVTPDVASDVAKNFVRGLLTIEGRMISLISIDNLIPQTEPEAA